MATSEDMHLEAGDNLGGIGGGNIVDEDEDRTRAVRWKLPAGGGQGVHTSGQGESCCCCR